MDANSFSLFLVFFLIFFLVWFYDIKLIKNSTWLFILFSLILTTYNAKKENWLSLFNLKKLNWVKTIKMLGTEFKHWKSIELLFPASIKDYITQAREIFNPFFFAPWFFLQTDLLTLKFFLIILNSFFRLPIQSFDTWFCKIKFYFINTKQLRLEGPNLTPKQFQWLKRIGRTYLLVLQQTRQRVWWSRRQLLILKQHTKIFLKVRCVSVLKVQRMSMTERWRISFNNLFSFQDSRQPTKIKKCQVILFFY
jgi:hypothetical protein